MANSSCRAELVPGENETLLLENDLLAATVLLDRGADISRLVYKPQNVDVLWKTPWAESAARRQAVPGVGTPTAWLALYRGGWQEIFPNAGDPCKYKGVDLGFHGEASLSRWNCEIVTGGGPTAEVRLSTRLLLSPFRIERIMSVEAGRPVLRMRERVTNEGGESMDFMWGHHPAFGGEFADEHCRIDVGAKRIVADETYDVPLNPMELGKSYIWPYVQRNGKSLDLTMLPAPEQRRHMLAYLQDFEEGWYAFTNTRLGFGVGLAWPLEVFPYAWFWQEFSASEGFPWYRSARCAAIEPFTSIPGHGLVTAMERTGTHRTLAAGESLAAELSVVFFESRTGVSRIAGNGDVTL
jgi:hypothetical protein